MTRISIWIWALLAAIVPLLLRIFEISDYVDTNKFFYLSCVGVVAVSYFYYTALAKQNPESIHIRRIAGVDAIEESIGRSTEMGRSVLYVTGVEELQNIQTIASLLVLGPVAEMTASYDTELKVVNYHPLTMVVAEEVVRQSYANMGYADAHRPENIVFISSEQFAFAAGINGMILRDKPATNIYFGRFFAESLMLAETGYVTNAVQIAGTAEITQLPFFIAACDYTIIGEEIYAVSAYITRDARLLAMLKASDIAKAGLIGTILLASLWATVGDLLNATDWFNLGKWLLP